MTDLREHAPAQALMEKVVSLRGTRDLVDLPFGIVKLSKDGVSWLRGVNGEIQIARQLRRLGVGWTVLHSVPVGDRGSDIDHIVVGPTGVFPINAKRLLDRNVWVAGGTFLVDGRKRDYLRNSEHEASRVEGVLRAAGIAVRVTPVIAVSGAKQITIKSTPTWNGRNIGVASAGQLVRRMKRRAVGFSPEQVAQIVAAMSDSSAWTRKPAAEGSASDIQSAFAQIDRGVTRWNISVGLLSFVIVMTLVWATLGYLSALVR
jgi:hypothetical protein